jgi:hypothetical protein
VIDPVRKVLRLCLLTETTERRKALPWSEASFTPTDGVALTGRRFSAWARLLGASNTMPERTGYHVDQARRTEELTAQAGADWIGVLGDVVRNAENDPRAAGPTFAESMEAMLADSPALNDPLDNRCLGCGEPKDNGKTHGQSGGFGGCV